MKSALVFLGNRLFVAAVVLIAVNAYLRANACAVGPSFGYEQMLGAFEQLARLLPVR